MDGAFSKLLQNLQRYTDLTKHILYRLVLKRKRGNQNKNYECNY